MQLSWGGSLPMPGVGLLGATGTHIPVLDVGVRRACWGDMSTRRSGAGCIQGVQGALPCKWGTAGLLQQQPKYDCVLEADPEADRGPRVESHRT